MAGRPVSASVPLPGSKSVTNRALVLAALAPGTSRLRAPLRSRDTLLMAAGLRALGAAVEDDGGDWVVTGSSPLTSTDVTVDVGNAGTVARFLPPVACLAGGTVTLAGDPRMADRPVGPLVAALRALGADVAGDAYPLVVRGHGGLRGGAVEVDAAQSSQLVSGLLLAAPRFDEGLRLRVTGGLPSRPHVDMTVAMMRDFGATVTGAWDVAPGGYAARDVDVEPDLSGAAAFLAAAAVTGGRVTVPGWPRATTQPGARLPGLFEAMGCSWSLGDGGLVLAGPGTLGGLDADLSDCGELAPVLVAACALASGPSTLRGIGHLRVQETDRLAALAAELNGLGGDVTELPDGLVVRPRPLRGGVVRTYDDHRIAMAAAVLGLVVPGVVVEDVTTTAKTMPDFTERWAAMLS